MTNDPTKNSAGLMLDDDFVKRAMAMRGGQNLDAPFLMTCSKPVLRSWNCQLAIMTIDAAIPIVSAVASGVVSDRVRPWWTSSTPLMRGYSIWPRKPKRVR